MILLKILQVLRKFVKLRARTYTGSNFLDIKLIPKEATMTRYLTK